MEYTMITGLRAGSKLLYCVTEKCLYVKKDKRGQKTSFICYQTILSVANELEPTCTARVLLDENGVLSRNHIAHSTHHDHERIRLDMCTANDIKSNIRFLATNFPEMSHKMSVEDVFNKQMSK